MTHLKLSRNGRHLFLLFCLLWGVSFAQSGKELRKGLVGVLYDDTELQRPVSAWYLKTLNSDSVQWQSRHDFSARWTGYLKAPVSGTVSFHGEADNEVWVSIDGKTVIDTWNGKQKTKGALQLIAGRFYPILVKYRQINGISYLKMSWAFPGKQPAPLQSSVLFFTPENESEMTGNLKKSATRPVAKALDFDVGSIIEIHSPEDVLKKREALIHYLWGEAGFPKGKLPVSVKQGIRDSDFVDVVNLKRIDKLTSEMEFGLNSIAYHFIPQQDGGELVIYHQGHRGKFSQGVRTINAFLEKGYHVIALSMPLLGMNSQPIVNLKRFGKVFIHSHSQMQYLRPISGHPVKYFLEPVVAVTNYAQRFAFKRIIMIGISGGGWTTTLAAAVDPRIDFSYPVAGSYPVYLRALDPSKSGSLGDYEQQVAELYRLTNYLELYIMGAYGKGRRQLQILNEFDACCFRGTGFRTYKDIVKKRVQQLGTGSYDVFLDSTHRQHQISPKALEVVFKDLGK